MKRTWYQRQSDGRYFRNCPLIMAEQDALLKRWYSRKRQDHIEMLQTEWEEVFQRGVRPVSSIPAGDVVVPYDDSPEATMRWAAQFVRINTR